MSHPLAALSALQRRRAFWVSVALVTLLEIIFVWTGAPLNTPAAPLGIVSYELAGSLPQAQRILDSWSGQARLLASFGLGLDYLFMPAYATLISLACLWAAGNIPTGAWARAGTSLAWGVWLACALDALENAALLLMLVNTAQHPLAQAAAFCAALKFSLLAVALAYSILGGLIRLTKPRSNTRIIQS